MSKRLGWAIGDTIDDLLEDMKAGINPGEQIIFYSITSNVIGYDAFYTAIVTYGKED